MIIESITGFACTLIYSFFSAMDSFLLPLELIDTLATILQYGSWVVGVDILLLFSGSVALWWGVKASVGIAIWVYEHIPLV